MKRNREFELAWQGLKSGEHHLQFDLDDRFIKELDRQPDFSHLNARVRLRLDKKANFFLCHFDIDGSLRLPCDRCGDEFDLQLWDEFDLVIKLTDSETAEKWEDEADVVFIPRSETVIDFRLWIYDYLVLSIPLQRVHPDLPSGESGCNPKAIALLETLRRSEEEAKEEAKKATWKGLDSLTQNKSQQKDIHDSNEPELN